MEPDRPTEPHRITVWVCDECNYWRDGKASGFHVTTNPADPNGAMIRHPLCYAEFEEVRDG